MVDHKKQTWDSFEGRMSKFRTGLHDLQADASLQMDFAVIPTLP